MKAKSLVLFAVAAGFGLVAMLGVMQIINAKPGKEPMVRVLVATADIPSGMPLDETNVGFKEFPQSAVPGGAVTKEEEYRGKAIVSRAVTGEIIMAAKLGGAEAITASHQIPKGLRVATVSVNATKSHSGLIRPTDRVDVVCAYTLQDAVTRRNVTHVKTVLDFIEVFAVDAVRAGREGEVDGAIKNVSLLVNPEQYQLLMAAEKMGELDLSLRNRADVEKTDVAELSDSVFYQQDTNAGSREGIEKPAAPVAAVPAMPAASNSNGLGDFLTAAMSAMSTTATEPVAAEGTPKWTMTICRGPDIEDVEVLDEGALPSRMSASERQRVRAESRASMPKRPTEPAKAAGASEPNGAGPKGAEPNEPASGGSPAGQTPAGQTPPGQTPAEPATAAQPGGVPSEPAPQAAATAATTPALVPFTPFGPFGN
jgi:pilus assembly protein CpaB